MTTRTSTATTTKDSAHTTDSATLMAVLLILFGGMWICWLWRLHPTTAPHTPLRCHQVAPNLRSTLVVFTILLLLSTVVQLGRTLANRGVFDLQMWAHRGFHLVLLLVVLGLQLSYLFHMRKSKVVVVSRHQTENNGGGCSSSPNGLLSAQRWVLVVFALLQVGVGAWVLGSQITAV